MCADDTNVIKLVTNQNVGDFSRFGKNEKFIWSVAFYLFWLYTQFLKKTRVSKAVNKCLVQHHQMLELLKELLYSFGSMR